MVRFICFIILMLVLQNARAQIIYTTDYKSAADLICYRTHHKSQVDPEKGIIYETHHKSQADWIVYWTHYESQADCVVYFTKYRSQAEGDTCYLQWLQAE